MQDLYLRTKHKKIKRLLYLLICVQKDDCGLKAKESELRTLNSRLCEAQVFEEHATTLFESFKRHIYLEKLDREAVTELIDKIVVNKPITRGDKQIRNVEIFYNFVGPISETK